MIYLIIFIFLIAVAIVIDVAMTIKALKRLERSQESLSKAIEELKKRLR